jgi:FtsZ-binding cell division protein ZapB
VKAWNLFNEFNYADANRDVISGQLRLAVDHLMFAHTEVAQLARNLAILIEENRDNELTWDTLLDAIRKAYREDHPEWQDRLEKLKNKYAKRHLLCVGTGYFRGGPQSR